MMGFDTDEEAVRIAKTTAAVGFPNLRKHIA